MDRDGVLQLLPLWGIVVDVLYSNHEEGGRGKSGITPICRNDHELIRCLSLSIQFTTQYNFPRRSIDTEIVVPVVATETKRDLSRRPLVSIDCRGIEDTDSHTLILKQSDWFKDDRCELWNVIVAVDNDHRHCCYGREDPFVGCRNFKRETCVSIFEIQVSSERDFACRRIDGKGTLDLLGNSAVELDINLISQGGPIVIYCHGNKKGNTHGCGLGYVDEKGGGDEAWRYVIYVLDRDGYDTIGCIASRVFSSDGQLVGGLGLVIEHSPGGKRERPCIIDNKRTSLVPTLNLVSGDIDGD